MVKKQVGKKGRNGRERGRKWWATMMEGYLGIVRIWQLDMNGSTKRKARVLGDSCVSGSGSWMEKQKYSFAYDFICL